MKITPLFSEIIHNNSIQQISFSPCSQFLATCSQDNTVKMFLIINNGAKLLYHMKGHQDKVCGIGWNQIEENEIVKQKKNFCNNRIKNNNNVQQYLAKNLNKLKSKIAGNSLLDQLMDGYISGETGNGNMAKKWKVLRSCILTRKELLQNKQDIESLVFLMSVNRTSFDSLKNQMKQSPLLFLLTLSG